MADVRDGRKGKTKKIIEIVNEGVEGYKKETRKGYYRETLRRRETEGKKKRAILMQR